jgi:hypothetical protein
LYIGFKTIYSGEKEPNVGVYVLFLLVHLLSSIYEIYCLQRYRNLEAPFVIVLLSPVEI